MTELTPCTTKLCPVRLTCARANTPSLPGEGYAYQWEYVLGDFECAHFVDTSGQGLDRG